MERRWFFEEIMSNKKIHTIQSSDKIKFDEQVNLLLELGCELLEGGYEVIKKKKKVIYSQVVVSIDQY